MWYGRRRRRAQTLPPRRTNPLRGFLFCGYSRLS
jgi:hypothetical protein